MQPTFIDPVPEPEVARARVPSWLSPGVEIEGRYRLLRPLGEGGVGAIWIGEQIGLGRRIAVKVLHAEIANDPSMLERFEREAKVLASLAHPHIVAINDYGVWQGTPYLVMELLEGRTLGELLSEGPLPVLRAIQIAQPLLRALSYAHARGVVHRDLKPANVFLQALPDHADHVKLLDFGFALAEDAGPSLTKTGMVVGTPWYMAPEATTGAVLDARADVYAVGVLVFEMILGRRPFEGEAIEVLRRKMTEEAPSMQAFPSRESVPPALVETVARALARDPDVRWPSANELALALATISAELAPPVVSRPPPAPVAGRDERATIREDAPPAGLRETRQERGKGAVAPAREAGGRPAIGPRLIAALVVLALGAGLVVWWNGGRGAEETVVGGGTDRGDGAPLEPRSPSPQPSPALAGPEDPRSGSAPPEVSPPPSTVAVPSPSPSPETTAVTTDEPAPSTAAATVTLVDPWSHDVPPALARLRRLVDRARPPERRDLREISEYAHAHHADARPVLLLGHAFARMHWMAESLERYDRALGMSPDARADPNVLPDLVLLATAESTAREAAALITATYGAEALPAIDAALGARDLDDEDRARLVALRARLDG